MRPHRGRGPAGPSGDPVIGLGVLHLNSTSPERMGANEALPADVEMEMFP